MVARSGRLTYAQLDALAWRAAGAMRALGVGAGDRVAASLPNDLSIVVAFHAAMRLGAIWVGVNRQLAPPEKAFILSEVRPDLVLSDRALVGELGDESDVLAKVVDVATDGTSQWEALLAESTPERLAAESPDPRAPAGIAYTSGTTGRPKGAVHSQHNLMLPGAALVATRGYGPGLRKADCFPLTILNLQALSTLLVAQAQGTAIVMDRVDPEGIAEWISSERATHFNGAPAMLFSLTGEDKVDPGSLRTLEELWSGGSHCPDATRERFTAKFGLRVHTTYGLTEAPSMVAILPKGDFAHADTSGLPLAQLRVRVLDEAGRELPAGHTGQIAVSASETGEWAGTYTPMLGYWGQEEAGREAVRHGVLYTGDLGRLDTEGYLNVEERQSSVILRGGANVYPAEVERVIDLYPGVTASCVVGVSDDRLGERVMAMIETSGDPLDTGGLRAHCQANLARYKVPEEFVVAVLPRNSMGKVVRPQVLGALEALRTETANRSAATDT